MSTTSIETPTDTRSMTRVQKIGLVLGPSALLLLLFPAPEAMSDPAWRLAAVAIWMAVWWGTEAIPVQATGMLPLALFPLLDIVDLRAAATPYAHPLIFLLLGGFILARAIERWNLHRRMALKVLLSLGHSGRGLIAGFMIPAWLLSMMVSNTSTTLMLLPVALAVVRVLADDEDIPASARSTFPIALMLGIAYAASVGGIATPIGTPPNLEALAFLERVHGIEISFIEWVAFAGPFSLIMVCCCWAYLTFVLYPVNFHTADSVREHLQETYAKLGHFSREERAVMIVFAVVVGCWVFRQLLQQIPGLSGLSDAIIAILGALTMLALPLRKGGGRLLDWEDTKELPWGMLVMIGGGLSLAVAATTTGLSGALGAWLAPLGAMGVLVLIAGIALLIIFLTELNSNTATTATMLPVISAVAVHLDMSPLLLIMPLVLSASCAFMLPVATIPNGIVYSSGLIRVAHMMRAGLGLNFIGAILATLFAYFLVPLMF